MRAIKTLLILLIMCLALVGLEGAAHAQSATISDISTETAWISQSSSVNVSYTLTGATGNQVFLQVTDENDMIVKTIDAGIQTDGTHTIMWDGYYYNGTHVPDGVYSMKVYVDDAGGVANQLVGKTSIYSPSGIAIGSSGAVYFLETSNGNSSLWTFYPDGPASMLAAGFKSTYGVAVDSNGNAYVADNGAIKMVYPNGTVVTVASGFTSPQGPAVDSNGNIYFVEYALSGNIKVIYSNGTSATVASGFRYASSVAVDSDGNVYLAEMNERKIMEVYSNGSVATLVNTGNSPTEVAVDSDGNVYYTDGDVMVYYPDNQTHKPYIASGKFSNLNSFAIDSNGNLYVANSQGIPKGDKGIEMMYTNGTIKMLVPMIGPGDISISSNGTKYIADSNNNLIRALYPDGNMANLAIAKNPYSVATDANGDVYYDDYGNNSIKEIYPNGTIVTVGSGFTLPWGVAVDSNDNVYVGDYINNAVKMVYPNNTVITLANGSAVSYPLGVAVDSGGNVYFANNGKNTVNKIYYNNGSDVTLASGFNQPRDVAVDSYGNVYVADYGNDSFKVIRPDSSVTTLAFLHSLTGLTVDSLNNVYVVDMYNISEFAMPCVTSSVLGVTVAEAGLADTAWPKFQHDNQNTGLSPYNGPQTNSTIWNYTTGNGITGSPAIGADGTIYAGSQDYKLYALNPDGTQKWSYTTAGQVYGSPTIGADGTIYAGCYYPGTLIYALNPDGTQKWSYTTAGQIQGSPTIASDGTIYAGSSDKKLYALNPDGTLKWSYTTGSGITCTPAIGTDGTIYFGTGSGDGKLYALYPNGTQKWNHSTISGTSSSPAIAADGTIYIGSWNFNLFSLNPDGTQKWNYATLNQIRGSPAIGADGTIYIGSNDKKLYALYPNGTLKWSYTTKNNIYGSPAIGADGTIYIGSDDNNLYALNPDGTQKWSYYASGGSSTGIAGSPAIGADGTLYIGGRNGILYAFKDLAPAAPIANFSADVLSGTCPLTVQFTDASTGSNITSWQWDFGDGTPNSTDRNPAHTYSAAGTYTVSLTTTNPAGSNTMTKPDYIVVSEPDMVNASITGYSIPAVMISGESYPVSVTIQNTGTLPWNESNTFRLGMIDDDTGDAYLFDGVTTRVWLPEGADVQPGESVTFTYTMTAPTTPGTYAPSYRMVWDGHQWFGEVLNTNVEVTASQLGAEITSTSIPTSMDAGTSYDVSITVKNTGTLPWNESSLFRLGMVDDQNGDAYKFNGATTRVLLPEGANVQPGESVTFTYTMTAPSTGTYHPSYQMVWDNHQWYGDVSTTTVDVSGPDAAIVSNTIPMSMTIGESYAASITVQNTGTLPWNESSLFRLGMVDDTNGDAYKFDGTTTRILLPDGANIQPGESVTFNYTMTAPTTPGTYHPSYQMVWDNHQWYGEVSTSTVNVSGPDAAIISNTIPTSMTAGETYPVSVTVQNTGTIAWTETNTFRLGMVDDQSGDAYKFNEATTRVWLPDDANVQPGESVTFNYTMTAPTTPGTYHPAYRMVWDGHQWFGEQQTSTIEVTTGQEYTADFTADVQSGIAWVEATGSPNPLMVQFTDLSTNATSWYWEFGDGTNSTQQNPSHGFAYAWSYNITLTVNTPGGERSMTKNNYINVLLPVIGNVNRTLNLSFADLDAYPQVSIENHTFRRMGDRVYQMWATGASLNAILDDAQLKSGAYMVTFYGSDLYQSYVMIPMVRQDNLSMITYSWYNNDPEQSGSEYANKTIRYIGPADTFGQNWCHHMIGMKIE